MSRITVIPAEFICSKIWSNHANSKCPSDGSKASQARSPMRTRVNPACFRSEEHRYSRRVHLLQNLVEPCEFEVSLRWFKGVPGKIAHADQGESSLLHERDVLPDLLG